jgi:hypothetical protein
MGDVRQGMDNFDDLVLNGLVSSGRVKPAPLPLAQAVELARSHVLLNVIAGPYSS